MAAPIPDLPVADILPTLLDSLAATPNAVLVAPPGAGKTTLVPLALAGLPSLALAGLIPLAPAGLTPLALTRCLEAGSPAWLGGQRIVMLEPRRLAARAAAARMADLIGEQAGGLVGYRTRDASAVSARTRIEVVTEGILLRRLLSDPTLDGIGCVIVDEVHERSLDADTVLAFCLDLQRQLRPELRLLAMSATAEAGRLAERLRGPVIESLGRMFEVEVRHAGRDVAALRELPDAVARAVRLALVEQAEGDVLAFLPGVGEIRRAQAALAEMRVEAELLPLHGELPPAEQDRVLRPAAPGTRRRHVVLATSIAETSLTVPGVRIVVDGGWRRVPRLDAGSGLTRLETVRVSRATATQRTGRAGREAPGTAYRLWTATTARGLALQDRPEILDAELSGYRLQAACWAAQMGTAPADLPLQDAPPAGAFEAAGALLRALGGLDAEGCITALGGRMAALGAHPRLAAMMLAASGPAEAALAADLAALLEERDPLRPRPVAGARAADPPAEIALRLELLAGRGDGDGDRAALSRIAQAARGYRRRLETGAAAEGDVAALLAAGFPDRIAQARGEIGAFRLSGGGSARLPRGDRLADARLLAVAALHVRDSARITLAAALDPDRLPQSLLDRTTEQVESGLDPVSGAVMSRRRRRLGQLVLGDRTLPADPAETARLLAEAAAARLATALDWTDDARQLQARALLLRRLELEAGGSDLPDLSEAGRAGGGPDWLWRAGGGRAGRRALAGLARGGLLRQRLGHAARERLDRALPAELALARRRVAIDYTGPVPTASSRAQDFYGITRLPALAGGRVRLQVALLSPAGRPAAITADLDGFWRGGWADMRRDMRGRYPRHDWPEDPTASSAPQGGGQTATVRPAR